MCYTQLTVSPEQSVLITSDKLLYNDGEDAILTCNHLGGPGNTVQWLRNFSLLLQENKTTVKFERLVVGEVFMCTVTNLAGQGHDDIVLNISPMVLSHPTSVLAVVNQSVEFCCNISSYPSPLYEWYMVDGSVPDNVENRNSNCLLVNQVSFGDEGEYYCIGSSNNVSVTSDVALLTGKLSAFS